MAVGEREPGAPRWRALHRLALERLESESEARRLVERASGNEGIDFVLHLDDIATPRTVPFFLDMLERRAAGEPLQYVLGRWAFRRLDLYLDRRVLIPRPETEMVVQVALNELARLGRRPTVVDLGTGSGAIALSIALEAPTARVWATERSSGAAAVARANLTGLGTLAASRVRIVEGDWFDPLPRLHMGHVQMIVSNPPYIADGEELDAEVDEWEPREALRSGPSGVEDIERIVEEAPGWLARPGVLVVEIAPHQAGVVVERAGAAGFTSVDVRRDLAGRDRILVASW